MATAQIHSHDNKNREISFFHISHVVFAHRFSVYYRLTSSTIAQLSVLINSHCLIHLLIPLYIKLLSLATFASKCISYFNIFNKRSTRVNVNEGLFPSITVMWILGVCKRDKRRAQQLDVNQNIARQTSTNEKQCRKQDVNMTDCDHFFVLMWGMLHQICRVIRRLSEGK